MRPELRNRLRRVLPEGITPKQLARAIAWRLQEKALGGMPADCIRQLDRLASQLAAEDDIDIGPAPVLKPGCRLVWKWRDEVHCVTVLEDVEDLPADSGLGICHETVRHWRYKFGPLFAGDIRRQWGSRMRGFRQWRWHLAVRQAYKSCASTALAAT